ncbi:hypothetical protein ID866_7742 [Astraeus odoratus]|nr:hypothetical protein ID866_7742 [Astraeus odoratus]
MLYRPQAIDKLSSFSRLSTPSPSGSSRLTRPSRSPLPTAATQASSSSSSSSRLTSHAHLDPRHTDALSGSETERESLRAPTPSNANSYRSRSPELSDTPPPPHQPRSSAPPSPDRKMRQASPGPGPGPSRAPRKRVSMASHMSAPMDDRYADDVADAALAAVASARRSPTGTGTGSINRRARQPLPREFLENRERRSLDGRTSIEPMTPHRTSFRDGGGSGYTPNEDISPRTALHTAANAAMTSVQYSPRGLRSARSSTARDFARGHNPRWMSDDLSNTSNHGGSTALHDSGSGRRQTQRGGSAESSLAPGSGRLAGESLRAAGIVMRSARQTTTTTTTAHDDPFGDGRAHAVSLLRSKSNATSSSAGRSVEWEDEERERRADDERNRASGSRAGVGDGASRRLDHARSSSVLVAERDSRGGGARLSSSRPATSMGDLYHADDGGHARNGTLSSRSKRTHDLPERPPPRESPTTRPVSLQHTGGEFERARSGTLTRRHASMTPVSNSSGASSFGHAQNAEHTRLMMESLSMFQSTLSRLPTQSPAVRDLQYQAETIIRSSERLNALLRAGTTHAVQQQIAVEVDDEYGHADAARIWRDVGADYRDGLRESDEVVRTLTGFILGVGKVLKEVAATAAASSASSGPGSESSKEHLRSVSLDSEVMRRRTPDGGLDRAGGSRLSQDGRRSVESRRSWDPVAPSGSTDLSRRISSSSHRDYDLSRPPSSARDRESASDQDRHAPSRNAILPPPLSSVARRLLTPREIREQQLVSSAQHTPGNVVDLSMDYEPSPTPASRHVQNNNNNNDRHKPSLPITTPPPLPSLPSESLLRKSTLADKQNRRKVSLASITTVRASNSPFSLPTSNPTTALTPHTVSSPEASALPLTRTDSRDSVRSSVTFSRPTEVSMSALQQQQSRDSEARRRAAEDELNQMRSPMSGSETERDTRRRTIGVRAARMSLDSAIEEREGETGGGAGGAQPRTNTITLPSQRRERRRTVTEIFG